MKLPRGAEMKLIIGFVLGLMVASAFAEVTLENQTISIDHQGMIMAAGGIRPDRVMVPIVVDITGHVVCSEEKPK